MKPGDPVLVKVTWAGCAPGWGDLQRDWISGHVFDRFTDEGRAALVTCRYGLYAGLSILYDICDIRPDDGSGVRIEKTCEMKV